MMLTDLLDFYLPKEIDVNSFKFGTYYLYETYKKPPFELIREWTKTHCKQPVIACKRVDSWYFYFIDGSFRVGQFAAWIRDAERSICAPIILSSDAVRHAEIEKWVDENTCDGTRIYGQFQRTYVYFTNDREAVAFKLQWGEYCVDNP